MKKILLDKKIIIVIIVVIAIVIGYFINSLRLSSYLRKKGFITYDDTTYYKKLTKETKEEYEKNVDNDVTSSYDYLYFNLGTNHMSEEIGTYDEEVQLEYIGEYSYKSKKVLYSIRGEYYSTTVQFTGEANFSNKRFSCMSLLHYDIDYTEVTKSAICQLAKEYSIRVYNNSVNTIDNSIVLKNVIKNTEE